jgi:hypothetical protein
MAKVSPATICSAALLLVCLWNGVRSLQEHFHWPVLVEDDWTRLEQKLVRAKAVLHSLPDRHLEYRVEDATETYDIGAYYRLQYLLAPTILQRSPTGNGWVLLEFWGSDKIRPMPDLVLVEDLGNGFGLYRRP